MIRKHKRYTQHNAQLHTTSQLLTQRRLNSACSMRHFHEMSRCSNVRCHFHFLMMLDCDCCCYDSRQMVHECTDYDRLSRPDCRYLTTTRSQTSIKASSR